MNSVAKAMVFPTKLGYFKITCRESKILLVEWPKIWIFFIRLPTATLLAQVCQLPANSENFWDFSISKNILFINFRD